nr:lytic murein transglycosylase B [Marinibactrum halimedae]
MSEMFRRNVPALPSLRKKLCSIFLMSCMGGVAFAGDYDNNEQVEAFIKEMVTEHQFEQDQLGQWFSQVKRKQSILDAMSRPAEKVKPWSEYQDIFLTQSRIDKGVEFWKKHESVLARAEKTYGVPAEIIVAIIGVETRYGGNKGRYRVMDALSTLAFDYPPRAPFFRKELKEFLLLSREQTRQPLDLLGSYAGAMGYGQFMPSSYRAYAADFDGDNAIDIWDNPVDAIGSVANYFTRHGWKTGELVTERVKVNKSHDTSLLDDGLKPERTIGEITQAGYAPLATLEGELPARVFKLDGKKGAEFWVGLHNFYVITRYNRSTMYAMAVHQLSQSIKTKYQG